MGWIRRADSSWRCNVQVVQVERAGRGLSLQDDAGRLDLVGKAFKTTGEIADIDDLKKALASWILCFSLF